MSPEQIDRVRQIVTVDYAPQILVSISGICFGLMDIAAKLLISRHHISAAAILLVRTLMSSVLSGLFLRYTHVPHALTGPPKQRHWLILRGVLGALDLFSSYSSLTWLQAGEMACMWYVTPIVTALYGVCFLGERLSPWVYGCGLLAFTGVTLVVQPEFLFSTDKSPGRWSAITSTDSSNVLHIAGKLLGFAEMVISVNTAALAFIIVRHIGNSVNTFHHIYFLGLSAATLMAMVLLFSPNQRPKLGNVFDTTAFSLLLGLSLAGAGATFTINKALTMREPGFVTLYVYVGLIPLFVLSWAIFGDVLSITGFVGCAIIVGATVLLTVKTGSSTESEMGSERYEYASLTTGTVQMTTEELASPSLD